MIWSLSSLRFLLDSLVEYVNLKHESDLGYKVRNPQHTENDRYMQINVEKIAQGRNGDREQFTKEDDWPQKIRPEE